MKKPLLVLTIPSLLLLVGGYYLFTFIKATIIPNFIIITLGAIMWILEIIVVIVVSIGGMIVEAIIKGLSGA